MHRRLLRGSGFAGFFLGFIGFAGFLGFVGFTAFVGFIGFMWFMFIFGGLGYKDAAKRLRCYGEGGSSLVA